MSKELEFLADLKKVLRKHDAEITYNRDEEGDELGDIDLIVSVNGISMVFKGYIDVGEIEEMEKKHNDY